MATDFVKRYFGKINTRVAAVNKQDPFSLNFINAITTGDNKLFQKHLMETRIFDGTWVDYIEEILKHLDMVVRNPRSFIKDVEDIVPIERAKKTTPESIRHLASHSHFVKEIRADGEVIPHKILTSYKEEEYAIYENRFIKTLVDKLVSFVERRYDTINKLIGTDYINKFFSSSNFVFDNIHIDYELNLKITKTINDIEAEKKNFELLERIKILRNFIIGFTKSEMMRTLKSVKPVQPPIQRTNMMMRDPHYRKCYDLWLFLDSYGKLDYTIQTSVSDNQFLDEYVENIRELTLLSFATVVANDDSNIGEFKVVPNIGRKKKRPKILSNLEEHERKNEIELERQLINEYYYQEARKIYNRRIRDLMDEGEPFHVALKEIYKGAFKITERIFADLMAVPEEIKEDPMALLRFKMRNQKALDEIYKYKMQDLKKMDRERLRNGKQMEREKAKIEALKLGKTKKQVEEITVELLEAEKKELIKILEKENIKVVVRKEREKIRLVKQREKEIEKIKEQGEKEVARVVVKKQREIEKLLAKQAKEKEIERKRLEREKQQELKRIKQEKSLARKKIEQDKEKERKKLEQDKEKERKKIEREKERERKKFEQDKEKERNQIEREKERDRKKLEQEKQKELERIKREKERERARIKREKERALEKVKREKERERERVKKAKEKERMKLQIEKEVLKEKQAQAKEIGQAAKNTIENLKKKAAKESRSDTE